jgi:hypothetical protein
MPLLSKNPFSLRDVYFLLNHGLIKSTVLKHPGAGRGKRLIDCALRISRSRIAKDSGLSATLVRR